MWLMHSAKDCTVCSIWTRNSHPVHFSVTVTHSSSTVKTEVTYST